MAQIINFPGETTLPIPPDKVLQGAKGALKELVICGLDKNGELYFAASTSELPEILWLIEKVKQDLMQR